MSGPDWGCLFTTWPPLDFSDGQVLCENPLICDKAHY